MKKNNKTFISIIIIFIAILSILLINYTLTPKEGSLTNITYKEIQEKLNNKEDFILVISKSNCSHCATYKQKLTTIAKYYNIYIYYINYDLETKNDQKDLFKKLNFNKATPTTMFFRKGKETSLMDRLEGDLSSNKVIEKFKKMGFIKK